MDSDPQVEKEIKNLLDQVFDAFQKKDLEKYLSFIEKNENVVSYGSEAGERIVGYNKLKEAIKKDWERYDDVSMKIDWLKINSHENTAWAAADLIAQIKMGDQEITLPARQTMVFIKKDDKWKLMQSHFSIATPAPEDM